MDRVTMQANATPAKFAIPRWLTFSTIALMVAGLGIFVWQVGSDDPRRAWLAFLINFLLFSAMAHGALLFSTLMHTVRARWCGPLSDLAEAFSAFFPVSFVLFLMLFLGKAYLFPWQYVDLHGKEVWLNLPFLFWRDGGALFILYGLGFGYLYHTLYFKLQARDAGGYLGRWLQRRWLAKPPDPERFKRRRRFLGIWYMLAFAVVLSLLGYDLVMSADPHWYSTLFGAYSFVKAVFVGFGALIILAAVLHLHSANGFVVRAAQFHDVGKLFFAFCLVWADFFYAQFVVIWYGNIPEETAYIIIRTMAAPWQTLAWTVFAICFVGPFLILINKKIKTVPAAMVVICSVVMVGMWLEHFLLLAPAFYPHANALPLSWVDGGVTLGFLGLMVAALASYLEQFPELLHPRAGEGS
jgi:hypothetical protein